MSHIAFLFSGQDPQYQVMMREFYDEIPACNAVFHLADQTLGRRISKLCFYGTQDDLNLTQNTQSCILASELAALAAIKNRKLKLIMSDFGIGMSCGVASVIIGTSDALPVITTDDYFKEAYHVDC